MCGTASSRPPEVPTTSAAARASSVSRAMVKTIPGSITPERSGSTGRVRVCVVTTPPITGDPDRTPVRLAGRTWTTGRLFLDRRRPAQGLVDLGLPGPGHRHPAQLRPGGERPGEDLGVPGDGRDPHHQA